MNFFESMTKKDAAALNPLVLAYVGDAVQSLFVREKLAREHDSKAGDLHQMASKTVNAHTQAMWAERVYEGLTEEEKDIFHRARNAKAHHKAKNQSGVDYRKATGLEAVVGYLYLVGDSARLKQLLEVEE